MAFTPPQELLGIPHRRDLPFSRLTTLGLGGLCRWLFEPETEAEAQRFVRGCRCLDIPFRILGGGCNLLVLGDIEEPVLRLRCGAPPVVQGNTLTASAAQGHIALAEAAAQAGLSGLEWAGGIPGSLGGALRMNAGAHGGEWIQVLERYRFLDPNGELVDKAPEPGEFGYRHSWLDRGQVLLSATARLAPGDPAAIRNRMLAFRERRALTQPKGVRSGGCAFRNPPGASAGALIEQAGLKGFRVGDAEVSPVHANFLVNRGQASPRDFVELLDTVRRRVQDQHGVLLEMELETWAPTALR